MLSLPEPAVSHTKLPVLMSFTWRQSESLINARDFFLPLLRRHYWGIAFSDAPLTLVLLLARHTIKISNWTISGDSFTYYCALLNKSLFTHSLAQEQHLLALRWQWRSSRDKNIYSIQAGECFIDNAAWQIYVRLFCTPWRDSNMS